MRTKTHIPSVLIVDDERGPRESLRMILKPHYRVSAVQNAHAAMDALAKQDIDLVTIDLNMPGMKGNELLRIVRRDYPETEVVIITGFGTLETAIEAIRYGACDYVTKPFDIPQVMATVSNALSRRAAFAKLHELLIDAARTLGKECAASDAFASLTALGLTSRDLRLLLTDAFPRSSTDGTRGPRYIEFMRRLIETLEWKEPYMRGHAIRVAYHCSSIADILSFSPSDREVMEIVAISHDIGMLAVPSDILLKEERLTKDEWKTLQEHSECAARMLEPLELGDEIIDAVRHHHEHIDGSGYPDGIEGKNIPLLARIVLVADAYDAMSSDRPYRRALTKGEIVYEFQNGSGRQFDAELVDLLLKNLFNEEWGLASGDS